MSRVISIAILASLTFEGAFAHSSIEEVVVSGRAEQQLGNAISASEGLVGYDDLDLQPRYRVGELLETVPGMVATQHSGTGKANQYFLRGFNLDHGTDFSTTVDGVPVNFRTHGHGQGYLDLNFLIPELVESNQYRKGPYHARSGDFSSAGNAEFKLYDEFREHAASLTLGKDEFARMLITGSQRIEETSWLYAFDVNRYAGPWQLDEDLDQKKFYISSAFQFAKGLARVSLQGYDSAWVSTDQIPSRAVTSGRIDRLGFIDPDLGGETSRYALTANWNAPGIEAGAYHLWYDFALWSNFTYLLEDPVNGDEFEQRDKRTVSGAWVQGDREFLMRDREAVWTWGAGLRHDDIDEVGLYYTRARQRIGTVRDDAVTETSAYAWSELALSLTDQLRLYAGLRADHYRWDVDALLDANSGDGSDSLLTPSLSLAWLISDDLEAYISYGNGFHSNDVRGATITVDPVTLAPADPVDVLIESTGTEVGLRWEIGRMFSATASVFQLELDSELVYVGDGGATEASDPSRRLGVEVTGFWQPTPMWSLDASFTHTNAEFEGSGDAIPGAVEETFSFGANALIRRDLTASVRVRYLGDTPLIEDGSVESDDSLLVNAGLAWRTGPVRLRLDVFNLFDSEDADISYFYESRLSGEAAPVSDVHFHPLEPRSWRATVTYLW